ncbi:MAG TPA: UDP-3-O-(3-hydroxymyristoyl)glucosamine N-acyltransferase, partial [Candidatus Synoicihabitans sp.]|nr:UDP-3-O-(3-hydroxymyristoyl)glucosamine N-acyltransferase [Candidatus Synoicihabitans sp.]
GIASLNTAAVGELSFLGNAKYKADVARTQASIVLVPPDFPGEPAAGQAYFHVANPSAALARVCARIEQALWPKPAPGVHPSAVVASDATVAASATIGPLCVVESGAVIGERTHLQAQVFVGRGARIGADNWIMAGGVVAAECELHDRVRLQPGVVIGSDGFGYEFVGGRHEKVPQVGHVVIEADVEIGANTTLDRARFSRTLVGEGTKIDNLVQIGHNVLIGKHCLLCAQVGISGSTTIEDYVVLAGQVGVGGHITIGRGAKAGGQAGITGDVPAGSYLNGTPAMPYLLERRIAVLQPRLPNLFKQVEALIAAVDDLKKSSAH